MSGQQLISLTVYFSEIGLLRKVIIEGGHLDFNGFPLSFAAFDYLKLYDYIARKDTTLWFLLIELCA